MKIRVSSKHLFATISTAYFAFAAVAAFVGVMACLLGGHIDIGNLRKLPMGIEVYPASPTLTGLRGALAFLLFCALYAVLSAIATWIVIRIGLWLARKLPGVELETIK